MIIASMASFAGFLAHALSDHLIDQGAPPSASREGRAAVAGGGARNPGLFLKVGVGLRRRASVLAQSLASLSLFKPGAERSEGVVPSIPPRATRSAVDPLLELVHCDARAAARFIRVVMLTGTVGGLVAILGCGLFLSLRWNDSASCPRPLKLWLLVHSVLQLVQVPVRIVFLVRLGACACEDLDAVEVCVRQMTQSRCWRASRGVAAVTYAWLILGVIWVLHVGAAAPALDDARCTTSPSSQNYYSSASCACRGVLQMTLTVLLQAGVRVAISLKAFRQYFGEDVYRPVEETTKLEGASPEELAALEVVQYEEELLPREEDDSSQQRRDGEEAEAAADQAPPTAPLGIVVREASCAICLAEHRGGELLRRLHCGHCFHVACADRWLQRSRRCPLCMTALPVYAISSASDDEARAA